MRQFIRSIGDGSAGLFLTIAVENGYKNGVRSVELACTSSNDGGIGIQHQSFLAGTLAGILDGR